MTTPVDTKPFEKVNRGRTIGPGIEADYWRTERDHPRPLPVPHR